MSEVSQCEAKLDSPEGEAAIMPPARRSKRDIAAIVCSMLGVGVWLAVLPLLDACQQGEQLARYFAALWNVIVLSVVGGSATVLLLVGLALSLGAVKRGQARSGRVGQVAALLGLAIGAAIVATTLPQAVRIMN